MSTTEEVTCRLRVRTDRSDAKVVSLSDYHDIPVDIRRKWAEQITKSFHPSENKQVIRAWDLILDLDGSIEFLPETIMPKRGCKYVYPTHYRIPLDTIDDLSEEDQVRRAELFAVGSILYSIYSSKKPFDELSEEQVQSHFRSAATPEDILALTSWPIILSCWSVEFAAELQSSLRISNKFFNDTEFNRRVGPKGNPIVRYARQHPFLFAAQSSGVVLSAAAIGAPLILGAVGFGAMGPIAGSVAAGWQSSMGIVQAGSLFAWCQSAAMGGAAASAITAAGVVGAGTAVGATGLAMGSQLELSEAVNLLEKYQEVFRGGVQGVNKLIL